MNPSVPNSNEPVKPQGTDVAIKQVSPWHEAVDGAAVLDEISKCHTDYVSLPDYAADTCALWEAHAHAHNAFMCSPRLNVYSPEKGCGKTTTCDVISEFVARPVTTENLTTAVLFRVVASSQPTILADEYDTWIKDNQELRGILNAGHRRGGQVLRCVGDNHDVRAFNVYSPAVLSGIGALKGPLGDRSIQIRLQRAKAGEVKRRFDSRHTEREQLLCRKLARWSLDNFDRLAKSDPAMPPDAFNRVADNWRPLFAVAEVAGGDWPTRALNAFRALNGTNAEQQQSFGTLLLSDVRQIFAESKVDRLSTEDLCSHLNGMSERDYVDMRGGKGINGNKLATVLREFQVRSRKLRLPSEPLPKQGYYADDFSEAWGRFLPFPENNGTSEQAA